MRGKGGAENLADIVWEMMCRSVQMCNDGMGEGMESTLMHV
jgi:hypothetical protein